MKWGKFSLTKIREINAIEGNKASETIKNFRFWILEMLAQLL